MKIYKFKTCLLNTLERRVVRDGVFLDLTPKTFDVLQLLVERAGEIVSKDEILGTVWNGSFVEEGNLAVHISKLRRMLEPTDADRCIETVHGTGYRFTSRVEAISELEWLGHPATKTPKNEHEQSSDSIAVLPLKNESYDADLDYLTDGLTESLINSLSKIPNVRVIARDTMFRYKNTDADAKAVGETLGVRAVVTGRITVFRDEVMISTDLVNVADGSQIWGMQLNRPFSDVANIVTHMTICISEQLRTRIFSTELCNPISRNAESYRSYLKGKHFYQKHTAGAITSAIQSFKLSIALDPANVHAYVQIIECYFSLFAFDYILHEEFLRETEPILRIITKLNQFVDSVQVLYGTLRMVIDWDFETAEEHFLSALLLNPGCLAAYFRYSQLLIFTGRHREALNYVEKVEQIDPMSLTTNRRIGRLLYFLGQYDRAIAYINDALELEPQDYEALTLRGAVLTELGQLDDALASFRQSVSLQRNLDTLSMIGYIFAVRGNRDGAREIIETVLSEQPDSARHSVKLARIHAALGEVDIAFDFLNRAFVQRDVDMMSINSDPRWSRLREDARFPAMIAKIGLTQSSHVR